MSSGAVKNVVKDEPEEDKELQNELKMLVERITGDDETLISPAIEMLKYLIKTATTSMTSVPKPLKYLAPYYDLLKKTHSKMESENVKMGLADIISVLAMGTAGGEAAKKKQDCLRYCLQGNMQNVGDWGHEYIRHLEDEIVEEWNSTCTEIKVVLMPLIRDIIKFNCNHHAEIQACDLLMEIDRLPFLMYDIAPNTFQRMCIYLMSCTKYVEDMESKKILDVVSNEFMRFGEYCRALIAAMQLSDDLMVNTVIDECQDKATMCQLAFICARNLYPAEIQPNKKDICDLDSILCNVYLSSNFQILARELDILEPKTPEDVYKTWLEPVPPRLTILGENLDSARQNLASSFVNGFVNAGFGSDKLLTQDGGNKWIYRNKEHCMMSATAALGLLYLWDVDGGLTPIDKYLYTTEDYIKSGALLALGIVNCRIRNECDPALALLGDYVEINNPVLQTGAILGIGLAYAGSGRSDVLDLLMPIITSSRSCTLELLGITSLASGLISLGRCSNEVGNQILDQIIVAGTAEFMKSPYMRLAGFGVALCYFGHKDNIQVPNLALDVLEEPFRTIMQSMLTMCSFAGSGDVLVIQDLLNILGDKVELPEEDNKKDAKLKKTSDPKLKDSKKKREWDYSLGQATAALAVASVSMGEELGVDMVQRIFGHIGRYGDTTIRKAVPLAIALTSVSNPQLSVIDVLTKYSHDSDDDVSCNAIYGLGVVGAGTNNARLAASLRQLAVYHAKSPSQLFMVRIAQGLIHLGKGTMTLNPWHTDRQLLDSVGMAGLLIPMVCLLEPHAIILGKSHFLLYTLAASMHPRWLLTLNEDLEPVSVTVRVGQAVDVVAKAGTPKTIAGIHTHTTPVLLATGERAELATDEYECSAPTLDGVCVLKKKI